ncbi:class I SAM-dependent methyltransferase [Streptomyces griseorubiginosus]|uniref:class I SAM-dependent methyltransferase n=1 Tax=Streptomyces griseorubiginosus TaxID=67304 RepID=UPI0033245E16
MPARHPGILRSVPEGCGEALDVGCGDGLLARKLAGQATHVTGIDKSPDTIACARESAAGRPQLTFIEGDFLTTQLPGAQYDFVCSVTTVHHMDFEAALVRMRDLLRPGGTLVVVGLAREACVTEWAALIAADPIARITKALRHARGPQGMPVADPQMSYGQVRAAARRALPSACPAPVHIPSAGRDQYRVTTIPPRLLRAEAKGLTTGRGHHAEGPARRSLTRFSKRWPRWKNWPLGADRKIRVAIAGERRMFIV